MKNETKTQDTIKRLYRLDELNKYEVSDNDTDVRGFLLIGGDGERLGKVEELIVDPEMGKVRYLDIKLDTDLVVIDDNRHILLPIGVARLDEEHDNIIVSKLNRSNVKFIPAYKGHPITREFEQSLRDSHRYTLLHNDASPNDTEDTTSTNPKSVKEYNLKREEYVWSNHPESPENEKDRLRSEIEVLKKELDIARAERDILKVQLEQASKGTKDDFYDHEDFDDFKFYESRKKRKS